MTSCNACNLGVLLFTVSVVAHTFPDIAGAGQATAIYDATKSEIVISATDISRVFIETKQPYSATHTVSREPSDPGILVIDNETRIGLTGLVPFSVDALTVSNVGPLAFDDLTLLYSDRQDQPFVELHCNQPGFSCIPEPGSIVIAAAALGVAMSCRKRSRSAPRRSL